MVGSMFAAVSGLKAHQTKLDVIGNNIANVNTWGFKSQLANIEDSIYRTSNSSSANRGNSGGGNNVSQVGYGANVNYISVNYATGNWNPTGWGGDCMIDGSGFFVVTKNLSSAKGVISPTGEIGSDEAIALVTGGLDANGNVASSDVAISSSDGIVLSRVAMLGIDEAGYLVDQNGYYVLNYAGQAIQVRSTADVSEVTGYVDASGNPLTQMTGTYYYDADNNLYTDGRSLTVTLTGEDGTETDYVAYVNPDDPDTIYYKSGDSYYTITDNVATEVTDPGDLELYYYVTVDDEDIPVSMGSGSYYVAEDGTLYDGAVSQTTATTTLNGLFTYDSITIQTDGTITAVVKSPAQFAGKVETLGQLGVASVENVQGLEHDGGYYYTIGANAGDVTVNQTTLATGDIKGGYLEMSNVDLSTEITNLITTQRGYQANTKIITVTDEMLETLVNMKR